MTTNFVAEVVGHGTPASDLSLTHSVARQKMNAYPHPIDHQESKHGYQSINQGRNQQHAPRKGTTGLIKPTVLYPNNGRTGQLSG